VKSSTGIETPRGVPRIVRVVSYHPYRTVRPWMKGTEVYRAEFKDGAPLDVLETTLATASGHRVDNHHGWLVEGERGERLVFYFSDKRLTVYDMRDEELPSALDYY
jgi:hypothetical protein